MERYYKSYATQNEQLRAAMCNPIYDFIWGLTAVGGLMNIAGLNLIWGKSSLLQGYGYVQLALGGGLLGLKYLGRYCEK